MPPTHMLCWNTVHNVEDWLAVFNDPTEMARANDHGLTFAGVWRDAAEPNKIHFLIQIADLARAKIFTELPESQAAGVRAGVIEGGIAYVEQLA